MQSGCYVSRLHSILSANLLRRRIYLFSSYECPIFQGNALGAFKEKRGKNFLKQSTFFKSIPEKAERNHEVCLNKLLCVLLFKVQCRAPSLRRFFWRNPCGGPFLCCAHLFYFLNKARFLRRESNPRHEGFQAPCYTNLATKFFAVRAFKFFQDAFSYCMRDSNPPKAGYDSGCSPSELTHGKHFAGSVFFQFYQSLLTV